jgi:predicted ester cyclase
MTRAEIDALLDRHRVAFDRRDVAALAASHAEDGTFDSPAAGKVVGRKAIADVYAYWIASFPDIEFTWGEPIVDGNRVALFWHFKGTAAGKFFGEARPGTLVEFAGAGEYVLSPEGIASVRHVFDFTGALVNAGVLKVKPAG